MNILPAATLLLASVANINADAADMMVPGLRGVDTADAGAAAADGTGASHSRRQLQNLLGDWAFCTSSSQCQNQCCSSKYSTSDGRLKCTPVGGFKPSEGCVDSATPPAPTPTPPTPTPPTTSPSHRMVDYLKQITGKNAVAGVHNRVNADVNWDDIAQWRPTGPSVFTNYARQITGKTPGMWSGDFLFDYPNSLSNSRWSMIYEAERQYNTGALVNIMFHTCNPRLRENEATQCSWGDRTNGPQSRLSDDEWSRLITDGGPSSTP